MTSDNMFTENAVLATHCSVKITGAAVTAAKKKDLSQDERGL